MGIPIRSEVASRIDSEIQNWDFKSKTLDENIKVVKKLTELVVEFASAK